METTFEQGTLLWYWFENWLVVAGFVVALLLGTMVAPKTVGARATAR